MLLCINPQPTHLCLPRPILYNKFKITVEIILHVLRKDLQRSNFVSFLKVEKLSTELVFQPLNEHPVYMLCIFFHSLNSTSCLSK